MASGEKIKAVTRTMIQKFDSEMKLEDVHESTDAQTQDQQSNQSVKPSDSK